MLPSQADILTAIDRNGYLIKYISHTTDCPSEYLVFLLNSLRKRGFLSGNVWAGFHLTKKGEHFLKMSKQGA